MDDIFWPFILCSHKFHYCNHKKFHPYKMAVDDKRFFAVHSLADAFALAFGILTTEIAE